MKKATTKATREAILNYLDLEQTRDLLKASLMIPKNKQKTARNMLKKRYRLDTILRKLI